MAKDVIKRINQQLMANAINVDDSFYKALWGNDEYTPLSTIGESSDYQCGAIANELEYAIAFGDEITRAQLVEELPDEFAEIFLRFYVGYVLGVNQDIQELIDKMYAITQRNEHPSWMTRWAIIEAASFYFDRDYIWVNENKITGSNLITNKGFENPLSSWTTSQSGSTTVARAANMTFEESYGIEFNVDSSQSAGSVEQIITGITNDTHWLSFFVRDDGVADGDSVISVEIVRSGGDGYYYNFDTKSWQSGQTERAITGDSNGVFLLLSLPIICTATDDITICFKNSGASTIGHTFYLDWIEFGIKDNPSIEVILVSRGSTAGFVNLWESGADPVGTYTDTDYQSGGAYYDQSYIGGYLSAGGTGVFQEILDAVVTAGVQSSVATLSRAV